MEHGYNSPRVYNHTYFLNIVFCTIKNLTFFLSARKFYKINTIKHHNDDWLISYFYPGDRIVHFSFASDIMKNVDLIKRFHPNDALLIGFCVSTPSKNDFEKIIGLFK
jgi:hypothetical protein